MEKIRWERLNPEEKQLYERAEKSFLAQDVSIDISGLSRKVDKMEILLAVLGDRPDTARPLLS